MTMAGKSVRELLEDCVLYLYSGTPPTNPEDARTGTQLCKITTSGSAVVSTDRSTPRVYKIVVPGFVTGNTNKVTVTIDGVANTYTYTNVAADDSVAKVAIKVAMMLQDVQGLVAVPEADTANVWVMCAVKGLALTVADGSGTATLVMTAKQSAARSNALQFGPPTAGVIPMETSATWKGTNLAPGTVGYFVLAWPSDPLTADSAYAYPRVQGSAAAVGGDVTIDPATVVSGAETNVSSFTLTLPTS